MPASRDAQIGVVATLAARVGRFAAVVWLILTVAFVSIYVLPGDPARLILGNQATLETLAAFRAEQGLDRPLVAQYMHFVYRAVRGEFGQSSSFRRSVTTLVAERIVPTLRLAGMGCLLVVVLGLVVPILFRLGDLAFSERVYGAAVMIAGIAPPYVLGVLAVAILAGGLAWISPFPEGQGPLWWLVPAAVLAMYPAAVTLRVFGRQLDGALRSPYALRARALGAGPRQVLLSEALPNVLPPTLAALANGAASFLTGTLFVEVIFSIPGLGRLIYEGLRTHDLALLAPILALFAIGTTALASLLDLTLFLLDPRFGRRHSV